jgi:alkaline phosphatase D
MSKFTRRGALGLGAAGVAAAAVAAPAEAQTTPVQFLHGVASGDPRADRVVIWTRATPARAGRTIKVNWFVASDPGFKQIVRRGEFRTGPNRDYTVKVDVDGLEAGRPYYYWFQAGKSKSPGGATRTLPDGPTSEFRIAIVSCSNWPFGYFNAYREIAKRNDVHAVAHLGDYIYEYGTGGYGGQVGKELGRNHDPEHETVKLADYRRRYAQYRSDPDLQAAHAVAPWFVTWDDHESTNNSYRTGAENHQPETEGDWTKRKLEAVQAYLEWMPIRDPEPGKVWESIYRKFDVGDLATLFCLESRLVGRDEDLTFDEIWRAAPNEQTQAAAALKAKIDNPARTMLGAQQEAWLAEGLKASTASGKRWQVLVNQVTMAKVKAPDLEKGLSPEQYEKVSAGSKRFYSSARYGLEWNPDAWSGFPAARERLYAAARAAEARIITLTGDTHTAWANELHDKDKFLIGLEFGCTSVTSNGAGDSMPFKELNWLMTEANDEVVYYNAFDKGFTIVTLRPDSVQADYIKVSTVRSREYFASVDASFTATRTDIGVSRLTRGMGGSTTGEPLQPARAS